MGMVKRVATFGLGSGLGVLVGGGLALLLSPGSGQQVQARLRGRIDDVKDAGEQAHSGKQQELISRYRLEVSNPNAFTATD